MNIFLKTVALFFVLLIVNINVEAQSLTYDFTTKKLSGYEYAPSHVFAVWIETSTGSFVNTVAQFGFIRSSELFTWGNKSGGLNDDAVTGATLHVNTAHSYSWNMKNYRGQTLTTGDYKLCFEMTSGNRQGPVLRTPFTLNGTDFTLSPADQTYLVSQSVVYKSGVNTAVSDKNLSASSIIVAPNPVTENSELLFDLPYATSVTYKLVSISGDVLSVKAGEEGVAGVNKVKITSLFSSLPKGVSFILVETNTFKVSTKIINN